MARRCFEENLRGRTEAEARNYLLKARDRPESIETFELGYSEASGQALVRALGEKSFPGTSGCVRDWFGRREDGRDISIFSATADVPDS